MTAPDSELREFRSGDRPALERLDVGAGADVWLAEVREIVAGGWGWVNDPDSIELDRRARARVAPRDVPATGRSVGERKHRLVRVVGAGPAGLMAAEVLAKAGVEVVVHDRMATPGRKLLLAGRGGLNLTHSEPLDRFLGRYGGSVDVTSAVRAFQPSAFRAWCAELGEPTFVGSSGRVFPESFRASSLLRAWLDRLTQLGVRFEMRSRWLGWEGPPGTRELRFSDRHGIVHAVSADAVILALGGASWPRSGSDGAWTGPIRAAGLAVEPLRAANSGVLLDWSAHLRDRFAGHPVKNVALGTTGSEVVRGDVVITQTGLEGGPVYPLGPHLRHQLDACGVASITIDLRPDLSVAELAVRLARRRPGDSRGSWLRRSIALAPVGSALLAEVYGRDPTDDPAETARRLKHIEVAVHALAPIERAISTAGGVAAAALGDGFMLSDAPGVFVAGEMLDWEAPTGGYLLQGCVSTGAAAARGALAWIEER